MKTRVRRYRYWVVGLLLLGGNVWQYIQHGLLKQELETLYMQTKMVQEKEVQSYVVKRISNQMEDIAYQQKEISDAQREQAFYQMGVANQMRLRAEAEQRKAQEYADTAVAARNMMEQQREDAIRQRQVAEAAKNRSDTLSYLALGRVLASLSSTQYQAGNEDVSALLAYAAWHYLSTYQGNVYIPALFNALSLNSQSFVSENLHRGGVMRISPFGLQDDVFISAGKYGEVLVWQYGHGKWKSRSLFRDSSLDFRDLVVDGEIIYALSFTGKLVVLSREGMIETLELPETTGWRYGDLLDNQQLFLASTHRAYLFDCEKRQLVAQHSFPEPISTIGAKGNARLVFGQHGGVWKLTPDWKWSKEEFHLQGKVTAYAWLESQKLAAVGMENGDIFLVDSEGFTTRRLVGHRSRITQLAFSGNDLLSSSYDCTLSLWDLSLAKASRVVLGEFSNWIYGFYLSSDGVVWAGDESGTISRVLISPERMAERVQKRLKRDFTADEWDYYIGSNIPKTSMKVTIQQGGAE